MKSFLFYYHNLGKLCTLLLVIAFIVSFCRFSYGQSNNKDDLLAKAMSTVKSPDKVNALNRLCWENRIKDVDKAIGYGENEQSNVLKILSFIMAAPMLI